MEFRRRILRLSGGDPAGDRARDTARVSEAALREAWLRAEAQCECQKTAHGHAGRCPQFLIWEDRGETGKGGWEIRPLDDPRKPPFEILCAACYTRATGRLPIGIGTTRH